MLRSLIISVLLFTAAAGAAANAAAGDSPEAIKINGDLRYRHENIDQEGSAARTRQRLRARLALTAELDENLKLHFQLASGSDDPVSTNQTLGDAATTKNFGLDLAYFAWTCPKTGAVALGGKMKNPFKTPGKTELIWDGDLNPEGLAARYQTGSDKTKVFVTGAGFWVDERSSNKDAMLAGAQAGVTRKLDGAWFTLGGSYYGYSNLAGPLYNDDFFGNTLSDSLGVDADGNAVYYYGNKFRLVEAFAEFGFETRGLPVAIFADFVSNSEADQDEQAYLFGVMLNKAKKPGSWALSYNYREVQADAVLGVFTDSDFIGGGTDGKGHELGGAYQISPDAQLAVTYFLNKVGLEAERDYKRLQVDLMLKF